MNLKINNTILKKIAFILLLFIGFQSWGQQFIVTEKPKEDKPNEGKPKEEPLIRYDEKEYNALLKYVPKSFIANEKTRPNNRYLLGDLNSISSLELRYAYLQQLNLNEKELKWLEGEIEALAVAFFNEGRPILLKKTGEYKACTGQGVETKVQNKSTLSIVYFCYVNPGAAVYEDRFLEIFNKRTEKLLATKK